MKRITLILSSVLLFGMFPFSSAHAIKKCQDADGQWHYGDIAVAQCKQSKITTLNDRGFVKSERDAPKTPEQLQKEAAEQAILAAQAEFIRAEDNKRNRILSVYETEADIDRQRDNQIDSVNSNIAVHMAYIKSLAAKIERLERQGVNFKGIRKKRNLTEIAEVKTRVAESNVELLKLADQKSLIVLRFGEEKEVYLELTQPK